MDDAWGPGEDRVHGEMAEAGNAVASVEEPSPRPLSLHTEYGGTQRTNSNANSSATTARAASPVLRPGYTLCLLKMNPVAIWSAISAAPYAAHDSYRLRHVKTPAFELFAKLGWQQFGLDEVPTIVRKRHQVDSCIPQFCWIKPKHGWPLRSSKYA